MSQTSSIRLLVASIPTLMVCRKNDVSIIAEDVAIVAISLS
jgi:hypothetical protein